MALTRRVELLPWSAPPQAMPCSATPSPATKPWSPISPPHQPVSLFCHRRQTDQLILLRGSLELVVLEDGRLVRIPPGVPYGAINTSRHYATVVNAVLRHGPPDPRDYQPRPLPHSLRAQWQELMGEPAPADPPRPAGAGDQPSHSAPGRG
ncbi:cupin domain-containing protein [Synechococcus sp. RedBA-s]|uniref:cupin domain-containing protein n=1 Tax=Synechococcus sp. RedBA-s TaxID=2823741 RepID=UPI0020CD335F|nr:cupin domain-containing protein [Synechococcus sp. RedBA-s]